MFTLLKLLVGSGVLSGAVKAKFRAAKQAATVVAGLAAVALVTTIVGFVCIAAAAFFALRPVMADYQAALAVGGAFICVAGIVALAATARLNRAMSGSNSAQRSTSLPVRSESDDGVDGRDPIVRLISESVQSPVVMSALAMGIVAGRISKRSRRD